jgi:GR25 family glycosyltransferase involved in LPS biosynthesis
MNLQYSKENFKNNQENSQHWINEVDIFVYINLSDRKDKRKDLIEELKKLGIPSDKVYRINATRHFQGFIGCTLSHKKALTLGIIKNAKKMCLLEDDFMLQISPERFHRKVNFALKTLPSDFNVLYLAMTPILLKEIDKEHSLQKVNKALAMPAMIINANYFQTLYQIYDNAYKSNVPHDLVTQQYQPTDKWYGFYPQIGGQRPGFSDIELKNVNYADLEGGRMLVQ